MYEEFLRDPAAVGPEWRRLFESGVVGEKPNGADGAPRRTGTDLAAQVAFEVGAVEPARRTADGEAPGSTAPPEQISAPAPGREVARLPAGASPIKGPAARLVTNMTESLPVPTPPTFPTPPLATPESPRTGLNPPP